LALPLHQDHLTIRPNTEGLIIETILVVDDVGDVADVIRDILESRDYTVLTTNDPGAALVLFDSHRQPIDLLVTDVLMPTANGRDLAELARDRLPDIKVIYMTGHPLETLADHGIRLEGALVLSKPVTVDSLLGAVRRALGHESP
jgi:CheY-like chemotaxis protein